MRRPVHAGSALIIALAALAASCSHPRARAVVLQPPARIGTTETGIASWYGFPYDGRQTASGEVYDMRQFTAAHRDLPFQTWVRVENLINGKRVEVRITDRGPFVRNRIIDLSQAAADKIDMLRPGTARVRLTVIARPRTAPPYTESAHAPPLATTSRTSPEASSALPALSSSTTQMVPMPRYAVQAGLFADREGAETQRENMAAAFADARTFLDSAHNPPLWRVLVGREMTLEQANELARRVRTESGAGFVVSEPSPESRPEPGLSPQ